MFRQFGVLHVLAIGLSLGLSAVGFAQEITIGGTGSSGPLVKKLFDDFAKREHGLTLKLIAPPMGSGGAMKAILAGKIDLAVIGRELKPDEIAKVSANFPLAETPFVMISNGGAPNNGLSLDELAAIYSGKTTKWPSGKQIRLVLRATFDSDTEMLRSMSPSMKAAVEVAAARSGMVVGGDDIETLELGSQTSGSLAPTTLGLLRSADFKIQALPINGVTPSVSTAKNGSYPWTKTLRVVLPKNPSQATEKFAAYLRSGQADVVLKRYDYFRPR